MTLLRHLVYQVIGGVNTILPFGVRILAIIISIVWLYSSEDNTEGGETK
jgi:hypothetical protein